MKRRLMTVWKRRQWSSFFEDPTEKLKTYDAQLSDYHRAFLDPLKRTWNFSFSEWSPFKLQPKDLLKVVKAKQFLPFFYCWFELTMLKPHAKLLNKFGANFGNQFLRILKST